MSVHNLVKSAVRLATQHLKSDEPLFFVTSEKHTERMKFDAIASGVDVVIDDTDEGQIRTEESGWLVSQETFEKLSAFCGGEFTGTCVIRYANRHREVWKLLDEEPFTSLIDNNVFVRLNTYLIRKKRI